MLADYFGVAKTPPVSIHQELIIVIWVTSCLEDYYGFYGNLEGSVIRQPTMGYECVGRALPKFGKSASGDSKLRDSP